MTKIKLMFSFNKTELLIKNIFKKLKKYIFPLFWILISMRMKHVPKEQMELKEVQVLKVQAQFEKDFSLLECTLNKI